MVVSNVEIEVNKKNIKNMYLKVSGHDGKVSISAPLRMKDEAIIKFAAGRIDWIEKQLDKFKNRIIQAESEYTAGEIHYVWGIPYYLEINYHHRAKVSITDNRLVLTADKDSTGKQREKILNEWYRNQLKKILPKLVEKWESVIGVKSEEIKVRNMKSRWGTCNTRDKCISINLQLARKPVECLEYVVVHELVHLLEHSHNAVFKGYMDTYLPDWRAVKKRLNS